MVIPPSSPQTPSDPDRSDVSVSSLSSTDPKMALRLQLKHEIEAIRANGGPWKGKERNIRLATKALVRIVGGML